MVNATWQQMRGHIQTMPLARGDLARLQDCNVSVLQAAEFDELLPATVPAADHKGNDAGTADVAAAAESSTTAGGSVGAAADAAASPRANSASGPPRRRKKLQLLDVETAKAILAEPFDEAHAADRDLPLDHVAADDGTKQPLPGVLSLFLTGTTLDLLGCGNIAASSTDDPPSCSLHKEALLKDIQFRGAISDFHAFKQAIADADYDPLVLRQNATDKFGDGNNFELAVTSAAVQTWQAIQLELQRRKERDIVLARRQLAAKSLPAGRLERTV